MATTASAWVDRVPPKFMPTTSALITAAKPTRSSTAGHSGDDRRRHSTIRARASAATDAVMPTSSCPRHQRSAAASASPRNGGSDSSDTERSGSGRATRSHAHHPAATAAGTAASAALARSRRHSAHPSSRSTTGSLASTASTPTATATQGRRRAERATATVANAKAGVSAAVVRIDQYDPGSKGRTAASQGRPPRVTPRAPVATAPASTRNVPTPKSAHTRPTPPPLGCTAAASHGSSGRCSR